MAAEALTHAAATLRLISADFRVVGSGQPLESGTSD